MLSRPETEILCAAGKRIFEDILENAFGKLTKAEISGYTKTMDIYTVGQHGATVKRV